MVDEPGTERQPQSGRRSFLKGARWGLFGLGVAVSDPGREVLGSAAGALNRVGRPPEDGAKEKVDEVRNNLPQVIATEAFKEAEKLFVEEMVKEGFKLTPENSMVKILMNDPTAVNSYMNGFLAAHRKHSKDAKVDLVALTRISENEYAASFRSTFKGLVAEYLGQTKFGQENNLAYVVTGNTAAVLSRKSVQENGKNVDKWERVGCINNTDSAKTDDEIYRETANKFKSIGADKVIGFEPPPPPAVEATKPAGTGPAGATGATGVTGPGR